MPTYLLDNEAINRKLKWLIAMRTLFALLLLGSTVAFQVGNQRSALDAPFVLLYGVTVVVLLSSLAYGLLWPMVGRYRPFFLYPQIGIDTLSVTVILFVTGGNASLFSFLYIVIVIYSSLFVFKRGSLLTATFCSVQFAVLLLLEFNGTITPFGPGGMVVSSAIPAFQVFQKCAIMAAACFSVAFLSGYLSDQERQSKADLVAMEAHLERVQNLAQIGEMAAGLAHEIKNPLASLSGAIQILKGEMENEKDNMRLMHIVLRETDRLSCLVNNFLIFARPSAGHAECVDLGKALAEIVTLFEKDESFGQRVRVSLTAVPEALVAIDPLQLRQVIWNLLLNGAESIDDHGTITISVQRQKNERILVEVADDGCGMDPKTVKAVFNPFFTTKPNGTGLGLSIVYRILETYDCRLDVQSQPGAGSVFSLYFKPLDPAARRL